MHNIVDRLHPPWPKAAFIDQGPDRSGTWEIGGSGITYTVMESKLYFSLYAIGERPVIFLKTFRKALGSE